MTKDASSSSPGSIVPNTKTASRGRPWSGHSRDFRHGPAAPGGNQEGTLVQAAGEGPRLPGIGEAAGMFGPAALRDDGYALHQVLVGHGRCLPGIGAFPGQDDPPAEIRPRAPAMGQFPAVSPADSAGRGTRRGRYLLVHSLPTSPASPGRTGRPCRRPGWRPQPPDGPPAPRSAEAACPGNRGPRETVTNGLNLDYGLTEIVTPSLALIGEAHLKSGNRITAPTGSPVVPPDAGRCVTLSDDTAFRSIQRRHPCIPGRSAAWSR